ncbi:MAG: signal peptide peptidase SppA [bacterium]
MSKHRDWIIGLGIAGVTIVLILVLVVYVAQKQAYDGVILSSRGDKVAVVELLGPIYDSRRIVRQFQEYGDHSSVKAIVFRIESPGGGVAASQEIYEAVRRVRDEGKPVVVSMGSVAASGGYYVACGADTIMANPGTTTGSIGVIAEFINLKGLLEKLGVEFDVVKSGRFKDTGSPHRSLTPADKQYLQSWVDDAFDQFVEVVARERALSKQEVLRLADGRVFTGKQAYEQGLIDLLGDYDEAIHLAARLGGISGEPTVIKERRRRITLFDLFFQQTEGILRGLSGVTLQYGLN